MAKVERVGCHLTFPPIEIAEFAAGTVLLTGMFWLAYEWPLFLAFGIGGFGLMVHELGHKIMGRYRCVRHVTFVISSVGIAIGFITSLFGATMATPGGVTVGRNASREDQVWMALAGPATNFLVFAVAGVLHVVAEFPVTIGPKLSVGFFWAVALVNLYLGLFNLLPIPMFDGRHVYRLNRAVWAVAFGIGVVLAIVFGRQVLGVLGPLFSHTRNVLGNLTQGWLGNLTQGWAVFPGLLFFREQVMRAQDWIAHSVSDIHTVTLG